MKKKNYVLFILGVVCSMCVLSACGKTGDTDKAKSVAVESEAEDEASAAQEVTPEPTPTETPIPMITAEPKAEVEEKTPSGMKVEVIDKQYYVTIGVNVRSDSNSESNMLGGLFVGDTVHVTGICENGWYRVTYSGSTGYVLGDCLSETAPVTSYMGSAAAEYSGSNGTYEDQSSNQDYDSDSDEEWSSSQYTGEEKNEE